MRLPYNIIQRKETAFCCIAPSQVRRDGFWSYCIMNDKQTQEEKYITLEDDRFPWSERKWKTVKLARIYEKAGYSAYAERAAYCATWLQFDSSLDGTQKQLRAANFCQLRLCPVCMARRAKRSAYKLSQIMDYVEAKRGCRYIFLTLTVRNCEGADLGKTIDLLTRGWVKLIRHRSFERAVHGWFRAVEVTRNKLKDTYHPHIHAVLAVMPEYFDKKEKFFLNQLQWRHHWQVAAGLDYDPTVYISKTRKKKESRTTDTPSLSASKEAAKYVTKDYEYIDDRLSLEEAARIVKVYTDGLFKRRLVAFGGWLKDAAKKFDADDLDMPADLVHLDDEHIREDLAELIETYHWSLGAGDYILLGREINPERVCLETGEVRVSPSMAVSALGWSGEGLMGKDLLH